MTLLPALEGTFGDRPDAVTVAGRGMSWAELRAAAGAVAARISGASAVAVDATPSLETVVASVAGLLTGVPVVPIPSDSGPVERDHIIRDSGAVLMLSGAAPSVDVPVVPVDLAARADVSTMESSGPALILYTSGTTGPPKGVLLSRDAIAAGLDGLAEAWSWDADDVLVHGLPLYHVHGLVLGVLGALRRGCRLVHTGRPKPSAYAAAGGTLYFGVPTVWSRICAEPAAARALAPARLLVSGSAALPATVFHSLESLTGHKPIERYGMTETIITLSARVGGHLRPGRVGTPIRGVAARVVGDDLQVRGDTLFSGYLNRPDASAAAFTDDGWFQTGDAATVDASGSYRIVGRSSVDLIKTGGYRVGAGEVEDALLAHPAVREAAVIGAPHDDLGQEIVAYVVAEPVTPDELIEFVARQLSVHKRPRRVCLVDELPRNAMGKVQKQFLA